MDFRDLYGEMGQSRLLLSPANIFKKKHKKGKKVLSVIFVNFTGRAFLLSL
jgi:hypothetical protein